MMAGRTDIDGRKELMNVFQPNFGAVKYVFIHPVRKNLARDTDSVKIQIYFFAALVGQFEKPVPIVKINGHPGPGETAEFFGAFENQIAARFAAQRFDGLLCVVVTDGFYQFRSAVTVGSENVDVGVFKSVAQKTILE